MDTYDEALKDINKQVSQFSPVHASKLKSSSIDSSYYYYLAAPIIIITILLAVKPGFIMERNPDSDMKISMNKLVIWTLIFSAILITIIYMYLYKK